MPTRTTIAALALAASASSQHLVYEPAQLIDGLTDAGGDLAVADLNGDGLDDIVDAPLLAALRVSLAVGDGSFDVASYDGRTYPLELVDIDEDGTLDLLHSTLPNTELSFSRGLGDGTFGDAASILPAGVTSTSIASLDVGDVDGDGHVDVAYVHGFLGLNRTVLLGQGDGTFTATPELTGGIASFVQLGDVDGDGLDDLVAADFAGVDWLRSLGDGTFAAPAVAPPGKVVDLLGSAAVEFVSVESNGVGRDVVVRGLDGDTFEEIVRFELPFGSLTASVSATDADGDGLLDLVVVGSSYGQVYRQDGGDFTLASSFTTTAGTNQLAPTAAKTTAAGLRDIVYGTPFNGVFVARNVTYAPDSPFTDLGGNSPGSAGFPTQVLEADGADLSVRVLSAAPSAPVFAIWGGSLGAPLGPSAASPSPDRVLGPFTTSPLGTLEASATGALPLGLDVYAQWWIADGEGLTSTSTVVIGGD